MHKLNVDWNHEGQGCSHLYPLGYWILPGTLHLLPLGASTGALSLSLLFLKSGSCCSRGVLGVRAFGVWGVTKGDFSPPL